MVLARSFRKGRSAVPGCAWMRLAKPAVRPRQSSDQVDAQRPRRLPATMQRVKASTTKAARTRPRPGIWTPSSRERGIIRGNELPWVGRGAPGSLAGLLTPESGADRPVREEWRMRALQYRSYGARRSWSGPRLLGSGYNHPCRLAQRNKMAEIAIIAASTTARWGKSVRSFTMMFIPYTDDRAVIGRVRTAIRARRSAAMVTLVSVRAL